MTPQAFAADLATIPAMDDLTVRICSGGGDVWAAQAIGAMLENRLGTVTAQIEGICASAATIVASHCKVVKAAEDATYMIHPIKVNPNGFVDMEGLKQLMDALTVMRTNVLNQYAKKTGHTVEEVAAWMDATSWWTAAEAKENGFIQPVEQRRFQFLILRQYRRPKPPAQQGVGNRLDTDTFLPIVQGDTISVDVVAALMHQPPHSAVLAVIHDRDRFRLIVLHK